MTQPTAQPLKVLCILGHFQKYGTNAWHLVQALRDASFPVVEKEQCINQAPGPNVVGLGDIQDADIIYVYSHGLASLLYCTLGFSTPIKCRLLVVTLGVPNAAGVGGWDLYAPHEIAQVIDWQVTPPLSVPVSVPVKPLDGVVTEETWWVYDTSTILDVAIVARRPDGSPVFPRININCNSLATSANPVANHCDVPNDPNLIAAQVRIHGELVELMSCPTTDATAT